MAHLGLFSSHLPYILLVLSYMTCLGYYSFNKKGDIEDIDVCELYIDAPTEQFSGDHFSYFTKSESAKTSQSEKYVFDSRTHLDVIGLMHFPGKDDPGKLKKVFEFLLFSRPPPSFV